MAETIMYEFSPPSDLSRIPSVANHAAEAMKASQKSPKADLLPVLLIVAFYFIFKG